MFSLIGVPLIIIGVCVLVFVVCGVVDARLDRALGADAQRLVCGPYAVVVKDRSVVLSRDSKKDTGDVVGSLSWGSLVSAGVDESVVRRFVGSLVGARVVERYGDAVLKVEECKTLLSLLGVRSLGEKEREGRKKRLQGEKKAAEEAMKQGRGLFLVSLAEFGCPGFLQVTNGDSSKE